MNRHEIIKDKLIHNIEGENDTDLLRGVRNIPSLIVLNGDDDPL
jgi:hypothetical protein